MLFVSCHVQREEEASTATARMDANEGGVVSDGSTRLAVQPGALPMDLSVSVVQHFSRAKHGSEGSPSESGDLSRLKILSVSHFPTTCPGSCIAVLVSFKWQLPWLQGSVLAGDTLTRLLWPLLMAARLGLQLQLTFSMIFVPHPVKFASCSEMLGNELHAVGYPGFGPGEGGGADDTMATSGGVSVSSETGLVTT